MIYLDNAATQKPSERAVSAAREAMESVWFNPSSQHEGGRLARGLIEQARASCAAALGCPKDKFYFTSGGTESINTALFSLCAKSRRTGRHIVSTEIEHDAVLKALEELKARGWEVSLARPGAGGVIDPEKIISLCRPDTAVLSLTAVNGETGAVLDVDAVARECRKISPALSVHCDGVQAFKKMPFSIGALDCVSISGHKIGALKGAGGLYAKGALSPRLFGGGQEKGARSGTEAAPAVVSFGAAAREELARPDLIGEFKRAMDECCPGWEPISPEDGSPWIFCFSPGKGASEVWVRLMSERGIYLSSGSACARGRGSHVIKALPLKPHIARSALRISFSASNSKDEMRELARALADDMNCF